MRALLLILATIAVASMISGLVAAWASSDGLASLPFEGVALVTTIGVHGLVSSDLIRRQGHVEAEAVRLDLPTWIPWQAEKQRRRGTLLIGTGLVMTWLAAFSIIYHDSGWRSGLLGFNLAFQIGAFGGESAAIAAQTRLVRSLSGRAARAIVP